MLPINKPFLDESIQLVEIKRKELMKMVKNDTKSRYNKRTNFNVGDMQAGSFDKFYSDGDFEAKFQVGKYQTTVLLVDFIDVLKEHLSKEDTDMYDRITKAVREGVKTCDVEVHCTCADFKYRFQYKATKQRYLAVPPGSPENRFPSKTNPNNEGAVCKHLAHVLNRPSEWYQYTVKWVRKLIEFDDSILDD